MGNSKIIYAGTVLLDLTEDSVTGTVLLKGHTAHGADGVPLVGFFPASEFICADGQAFALADGRKLFVRE